ncbi:A disintegrin and metalloproteinase with thrombospondin motifs 8-like [Hypomesus transpacificus]|uniref:A disintegrin and metalloproteinase with thrombospondin motifs 8-like n=1 Tax=Hypomesus transpacificus TaxID=137520 RepID=UPI001F0886A9|nr:A disintegrin and metalloproteinase with thrombospondin motifs 8-like [Hypomesus transpacificus]
MCSVWCLVYLALCILNTADSNSFESEDIVPLHINRRGGRFWKRSEGQPSFRLSAFGRDFTLNLVPDTSFLSSSLTIQRIKAKDPSILGNSAGDQGGYPAAEAQADLHKMINQTEESKEHMMDCFFSGTVDNKQNSVVAVSLCHGIIGSFITEGNEYMIEPKVMGSGRLERSTGQIHVIKRRKSQKPPGGLFDRLNEENVLIQDVETSTLKAEEGGQSEPRQKRFVSAPRFIETLVVADASMTHLYGDEIQLYILTLMSLAAQLYRHPSLRSPVTLVVVQVLLVEDSEVGPQLSSIAGVALRNFCSWQQLFNPPSQRHPQHYDTAVLFTREDICGQSCDTLGMADVGTMCDPKRSCSIIEDNGLQAAYTAAHELGHVLSMPHDDFPTCKRLFGDVGGGHMMAPLFVHLNQTFPWSPCSALYITEFFDNGHGDCLLDPPETVLPLPRERPGVAFNLDRQCQQAFGEEYLRCPNTSASEFCSQLWCWQEGTTLCTTRNSSLPWADGSTCGANRTCLDGECVSYLEATRPRVALDGGWAAWGPWQQCSRTCGGGVEFSYRECSDPVPQNGGQYCTGQRVQYQSCNTQPCQQNQGKSFREEQCEKYNRPVHFDFHGNAKQWIPKYTGVSPRDRCKLVCRAQGSSEFRVFEAKVVDGTTCGPDTTAVCVRGQCVKAGCDLVISSSKKMDKCGVCGGTGLSCRKITGSHSRATYGYDDVVTIPAGATNIDIKQRSHRGVKHDGIYLAVQREDGGYVLNGNFSVSTVEQDVVVAGAVLKYSGSSTTLERIQSFQTLRQPLTIQLLATGMDANPPKIKYTFFIPRDTPFIKPKDRKTSLHMIQPFGMPEWVLGEWSECSKSCGSGWSRRNVECRDSAGFLSSQCDKDLKPSDIRACGDLPCPIWQMGPWSSCSRTCGAGQRQRSVVCLDYTGKMVTEERCDPAKQPEPVSGECLNQECL